MNDHPMIDSPEVCLTTFWLRLNRRTGEQAFACREHSALRSFVACRAVRNFPASVIVPDSGVDNVLSLAFLRVLVLSVDLLQVEAMKHAFAIRLSMGDPGTPARPFWDNSAVLKDIANPAFIESLRAKINDSYVLNVSSFGLLQRLWVVKCPAGGAQGCHLALPAWTMVHGLVNLGRFAGSCLPSL